MKIENEDEEEEDEEDEEEEADEDEEEYEEEDLNWEVLTRPWAKGPAIFFMSGSEGYVRIGQCSM